MAALGRFFRPPDKSFFLLGPRGTGKTTLIRDVLPDALVINLLRADALREMQSRPERLREQVLATKPGSTVFLDEIQRVPELLTVVHDLLESGRGHRFVLTGSSARKLRRGGIDLLAGRALLRTMHPFMAAELPEFDLDDALVQGLVPLVYSATDPGDVLASYAGLYLEQEVRAEGLTRNVGNFARFLEVVSFSHGAVLNVSNVAREAAVSRKTAEGYVEILEDLLLAWQVPIFSRRAQRATAAHPKFYYFDAGVYRSLRPKGPLDRPSEIDGPALEGLVLQHLKAWIAYRNSDAELFYWRTRSGVEVDFIVYGSDGFWALEVKNAKVVRSEDVRSLRTFASDYPECQPCLLYRGADRLVVNGIRCLPVAEFLRAVTPSQSLLES
jgi:uncharacterized protein